MTTAKKTGLDVDDGIPQHIAIIMDGNRRWAEKKGLPILRGHEKGAEQLKKVSKACREIGVKIFTVYAFSTENWKRTKTEVGYLMRLMKKFLINGSDVFKKEGIKFNVMGQIDKLPKDIQTLVKKLMKDTKDNDTGIFNLAVNYGGRQEIVEAVKDIIKSGLKPAQVDEESFGQYLDTAGQPDPDLLIRTSGEQRLSGFLPWQAVYSELYFSPKLWPDFSEKDLEEAIKEYQNRQRRFGK